MDDSLHERLSRVLSTHRADGIDDPVVMTESILHLNSLHRALTSFLPLYIEDEIQAGGNYSALRLGTFLFADVSGFTALSERIQRESSGEGAEVLTLIMNDYFAEMLEILAKSDGQLLKFAGDALLAFFPAKGGDISDALKAVRTGLRMQRAMKRFQPITDSRLTDLVGADQSHQLVMSIGMARGKLFEALVGNADQRDHMIQGELPGLAMQAEAVGEKDEVIVDAKLAALVVGHFSVKRMEQGFSRIVDSLGGELGDYEFEAPRKRRPKTTTLFDLSPDHLKDMRRQALEQVEMVAPYVAPAVLQDLVLSSDYHLRSENRLTATMFIYASGFSELLRAWGDDRRELVVSLVNRYYNLVQRAITSRGGTLARTDPYKSGVKLLATFGAPVAHPDDPDRAIGAALEMKAELANLNAALLLELPPETHRHPFIEQRLGITQGHTFAGEVGWKSRREYTVMGDDVNLSARLMAKAEIGQIVISERVYERVKGTVEVDALPPMHLKGKQHPIQAYCVLRPIVSVVDLGGKAETPLVGHEALLESLIAYLERTLESREVLPIALAGHNGSGKTRIARHVVHAAQQVHFRVAWVTCSQRDDHRAIFETLIGQLLNVRRDDSPELLRERLREYHLLDLEPGLRELLLHDTETNTCLTRNAFVALLASFLNSFAARLPVLLVVDDLHREHSGALDIFHLTLQSVRQAQMVVLVTYEPPFSPDIRLEKIVIPDLTGDECDRLVMGILHVSQVGTRLKALLWEKTHGRPLYVESVLHKLLASEALEGGELKLDAYTDVLPDALREAVMSRVDSCPLDAQIILRAAAVLGDTFTPEALSIVSEMDDLERVNDVLSYLVDAHMIEPLDGWRYAFRHDLTRGAIYVSLARSLRLKLHRMAGNYWRTHRGIKGQPYRLAHHLMKCGLLPQAVEVLSSAGEEAENHGDRVEAAALYRYALTIFPDERSIAARLDALLEPS